MRFFILFIVTIGLFLSQVSCGYYIFGPGTCYMYTNHEWPKVNQYPGKKIRARAFAEHKMPTDWESYWEIKLTITDMRHTDIKDIHAMEDNLDFRMEEERGAVVVVWVVTNERLSGKKPFAISLATEKNDGKPVLHVQHSAKRERFRVG